MPTQRPQAARTTATDNALRNLFHRMRCVPHWPPAPCHVGVGEKSLCHGHATDPCADSALSQLILDGDKPGRDLFGLMVTVFATEASTSSVTFVTLSSHAVSTTTRAVSQYQA